MIIRWLIFSALLFLAFYFLAGKSSRHQAVRRFAFLIFASLSLISIFADKLVVNFASWLGLNSGTDLLIYLTSFSFIGYVITSYRWRRNSEEKLTNLARKIAINEYLNNKN